MRVPIFTRHHTPAGIFHPAIFVYVGEINGHAVEVFRSAYTHARAQIKGWNFTVDGRAFYSYHADTKKAAIAKAVTVCSGGQS